jgi:hypothetical protein
LVVGTVLPVVVRVVVSPAVLWLFFLTSVRCVQCVFWCSMCDCMQRRLTTAANHFEILRHLTSVRALDLRETDFDDLALLQPLHTLQTLRIDSARSSRSLALSSCVLFQ